MLEQSVPLVRPLPRRFRRNSCCSYLPQTNPHRSNRGRRNPSVLLAVISKPLIIHVGSSWFVLAGHSSCTCTLPGARPVPPANRNGWMDVNGGRRRRKKTTRNASARTHATRISHYRAFTGPIVGWRWWFRHRSFAEINNFLGQSAFPLIADEQITTGQSHTETKKSAEFVGCLKLHHQLRSRFHDRF